MKTNEGGTAPPGLLRSRWAYRAFLFSAWCAALVAILLLVVLTSYDHISSNHIAFLTARVLGALLGVVGAPASMLLFVGMFVYLFKWDRESSRTLWTLTFVLTGFLGSSLYFFVVYRRQVKQV